MNATPVAAADVNHLCDIRTCAELLREILVRAGYAAGGEHAEHGGTAHRGEPVDRPSPAISLGRLRGRNAPQADRRAPVRARERQRP